MKHYIAIATLFLVLTSCKQNAEVKAEIETIKYSEETLDVTTSIYPENITKVLESHGGIDKWNEMESLVFEIEKPDGNEKTTTALKSRKSLIEAKQYTLGYDGKQVWLTENEEKAYKGNQKFYYNLMFYFYGMPFVLADNGIIYEAVKPLEVEGVKYPGIKVSYEAGVGESPEDEYILYFDEATNKMAWLGYTVTYFSKEKSKDFHFIKYSEWQNIKGLVLPSKLEWYEADGFKIGEKRSEMKFVNISVSETKPKDSVFEKTEGATTVE